GKMVKRGTYSEFLILGVDILSLFEKGNKQSEPLPSPGFSTLISESSVQSQQSPRPSLKVVVPEDQDVSFCLAVCPGLSALGGLEHLDGKVGFKTYGNYFTAHADWPVIIIFIVVNIAAQVHKVAYALQDWWLAFWANVQSNLYSGALIREQVSVMLVLNWYLGVYS
ncbi:hypothetical protein Celaphus_00016725, partial [Cervus elaphus hippelaphus]